MNDELYKYLEKSWRYGNHKKYQKYFKEWVNNITESQIEYFLIQMNKPDITK